MWWSASRGWFVEGPSFDRRVFEWEVRSGRAVSELPNDAVELTSPPPAPRPDGAALDRAALVPSIEWALFGDYDGGLVPDESSLPVGELRRLLREEWADRAPTPVPDAATVLAGLRESIGATEINRDPDEDCERQIGFDDGQEWMLRRVARKVEAAQARLSGPEGGVEQADGECQRGHPFATHCRLCAGIRERKPFRFASREQAAEIAGRMDWNPTCLPGQTEATIVWQVLNAVIHEGVRAAAPTGEAGTESEDAK